MERYQGRGRLLWPMNSLTSIDVEIDFIATPVDSGWVAEGRLAEMDADSRKVVALLCEADGGEGLFELHLGAGSVFEVTVTTPSFDGRFRMREGWPGS